MTSGCNFISTILHKYIQRCLLFGFSMFWIIRNNLSVDQVKLFSFIASFVVPNFTLSAVKCQYTNLVSSSWYHCYFCYSYKNWDRAPKFNLIWILLQFYLCVFLIRNKRDMKCREPNSFPGWHKTCDFIKEGK